MPLVASLGNPLGSTIPQLYLHNQEAIYLQPPQSNANIDTTTSIEPLIKKQRLDDPNTLTEPTSSGNVQPKSDNNMGGDDKDLQIVDLTEKESPSSMSEVDFARSLDNPNVTLQISIPLDVSNKAWNFNGQTLNLAVNVMTKVKAIKEKLQPLLGGMPINKIQLRSTSIGFLKDATSLAFYNIGHMNPHLELVPKTRGGRK